MTEARLSRLVDPSTLRQMDYQELEALADEIRGFLVDKLSRTGGHLSPNLGVVELTLALHRVFDSPRDTIIWDVGHQAYVHKIVTGRADRFDQLRQDEGLSGYPSRAESKHDLVENSHASTSLSYALGMALANPDRWVVAVIGDGALTGGMAYEAFNHISHAVPDNLIVVINDNGRSYGPTVGGLAHTLSRLRTDPRYEATKKALGAALREVPGIGASMDESARRIKESVKQILQPSTFFDVLGLKYTGLIDGHDLEELETTLERAKNLGETVVVHAVTEKGRGYEPALADETDKLHGVGKFHVHNGAPVSRELRYTSVFGEAMADVAARNPKVVAITAAMEASTGLKRMAATSPERVFDVGICEQHAVTLAAGLAMGGLRPVVCIYSTFLQRAFDQILMDVALHELPVVFAIDRAGITGPDGPSHHGVFDLSYLRMVPGMSVAAPASADELCSVLETALQQDGPVAIRFPRASVPSMPQLPPRALPFGEWEFETRGEDVLLLAVGRMVEASVKAAAHLAERGVSAAVINARWVKPLDERLPDWAAAYPHVVTVEDNVLAGGFGAAVLERLAEVRLAGRVSSIGVGDHFLPFGDAATILDDQGLSAERVAERVLQLVGR